MQAQKITGLDIGLRAFVSTDPSFLTNTLRCGCFIAGASVLKKFTTMSQPKRRLEQLARTISTDIPQTIGTLKLGNIIYHVPESAHPSRLPRSKALLDVQDSTNLDNLHFMLQKYLLGQDIFLLSQPGPYARRLALTFCR